MSRLLTRPALLKLAQWMIIITLTYSVFILAVNCLRIFNLLFYDGLLQIWNPLRRIDAGLAYNYFHGAGIPLLIYPLYKLFGSDIFAANAAFRILTFLAFFAPLWVVARAAFRDRDLRRVYLGVLMFALFILYGGVYDAMALNTLSPLALRTWVPLLILAVLVWESRSVVRPLLFGGLLPLALIWGTEQALALGVATVITFVVACVIRPRTLAANLRFAALAAAGALITLIPVIFAVYGSPAGMVESLRYNLTDITADQVWYFGTLPSNYISSWLELLNARFLLPALTIIIPLVIFVVRWVRQRGASFSDAGLILMCLYALITISSYAISYSSVRLITHGTRTALVALCILIVREAYTHRAALRAFVARRRRELLWALVIVLILGAIPLARTLINRSVTLLYTSWQIVEMVQTGNRYETPVSAYLDTVTAYLEDNGGISEIRPFWAVYSGLIHAQYGLFNPEQDYMIHALGSQRRIDYVTKFAEVQPAFVETMRRLDFRDEMWLQNAHWDFYERLLLNYEIDLETGHSFIWKRTDAPWQEPTACVDYPVNGADSFTLPEAYHAADGYRVIAAQVRYTVDNPWARVPIIGQMPRSLIQLDDVVGIVYATEENGQVIEKLHRTPVSLPPYRETWTFPLFVLPDQRPVLRFETLSLLPGASYSVESVCLAARDSVSEETLNRFLKLTESASFAD